jgi:hypothetical protein
VQERLRPWLPATAWAAGSLALAGVFRLAAGTGLPAGARGAAAVGAVALLLSLILPATSIAYSAPTGPGPLDDLRRWGTGAGSALAGGAAGLVLFALVGARGAVPELLAALVVVSACCVSFGALARAATGLLPGRLAGSLLAGAALLLLVAAPFWSRGFMISSAGAVWGEWLAGASPFLASAMPWVGASPWGFDPRTSLVLYDIWVGTDYPVALPGWVACAAGHLAAGVVLVAACELPKVLKARWRSTSRQDDAQTAAADAGRGGSP